jgi:hypothetical protein
MESKEELITKIIEIEWDMYRSVPNIGEKAPCQEDRARATFESMRFSQLMSWSEATLESYLNDLKEAEENGRNLLTEKYARMMKSTSPLEYVRVQHLLPPLDPEVLPLIDKIVKIILGWEEELMKKFPYVLKRGRPIHSSEDKQFVTSQCDTHPFAISIETYLRGELATYSKRTLKLYYENLLKQKSENINGSKVIYEQMIKQYGYKSLEEANEQLRARASEPD